MARELKGEFAKERKIQRNLEKYQQKSLKLGKSEVTESFQCVYLLADVCGGYYFMSYLLVFTSF